MKKPDFSKKILKILSEKTAISLPELKKLVADLPLPLTKGEAGRGSELNDPTSILPLLRGGGTQSKSDTYALTRSLKGLREAGLVESVSSGQNDYARLTREGKRKAASIKLEGGNTLVNPSWDSKWRIILLDLPESRKSERESLRYLLKKAGFVLLKNSAWISPYPFEHLFGNIKKDLGMKSEMMIVVTESLDEETEKEFLKSFGK